MKNRDVFTRDPITEHIPNNGVAVVAEPTTAVEFDTLRYELQNFVCEGQYDTGLRRILSSFLSSLNGASQQNGVWVSGFYGSGKSHLVRVLRYLWTNYTFQDGATARELVRGISQEVRDLLKELETAGKRHGGLHAAAGTIGRQTANDIPLAVLKIVLGSLGMPTEYPAAQLYLRLREEGSLNDVQRHVEDAGKSLIEELKKMYVSAPLKAALAQYSPGFDGNASGVADLLRAQFPPLENRISVEKMVETMHAALNFPGSMPLTLLVLDELQQFIGDSADRGRDVQEVVEACSKGFSSKLLFVATGQDSMTATANLQRLTDRFRVQISLSNADVESVTRTIVLNKKPSHKADVQDVVERSSGEIFRQLKNSAIAPRASDADVLVADYPILPARRRFWEAVLQAVDTTGASTMLRNQLRIIDQAVRDTADEELGHVVPADALYDQMVTSLQRVDALTFEQRDVIERQQNDGSEGGKLKARLCALVYLIGKLPRMGAGDTGVRANPEMLADLLVADLKNDGAELRRKVPEALEELAAKGDLMLVDGEYQLQTPEGSEWTEEFQTRKRKTSADKPRLAEERSKLIQSALTAALKPCNVIQGLSRAKRNVVLHTAQDPPSLQKSDIMVWVRDGWAVSEKDVRSDASHAGLEDPTVYVFIPARADELNEAIAKFQAADETLDAKGVPTTETGRQARASIEQQKQAADEDRNRLVFEALENSLVLIGGGSEIDDLPSFQAKVQSACDKAALRMFPKFGMADDAKWHVVIDQARNGSGTPLDAISFKGDAANHLVCKAILDHVGQAKRGSEVRAWFGQQPYGWPQDAIDGALLALLAGGAVQAKRQSTPVNARDLDRTKIGDTEFSVEAYQLTTAQRIELRKLFQVLEVHCGPGEEASAARLFVEKALELAASAGGDAPIPESPNAKALRRVRDLGGNEQLLRLFELRDELTKNLGSWKSRAKIIAERRPNWERLSQLLLLATALDGYEGFVKQADAVRNGRQLLDNPDPVAPLLSELASDLRNALQESVARYDKRFDDEMEKLRASDAWNKLGDDQWTQINREAGLRVLEKPSVGTQDELVDSLKRRGLDSWKAETDAIATRFAQAERMAAKTLEPTSVSYVVPRKLLKSPDDVDAYVEEVRQALLAKIAEHPVQVS